VYGAEKMSVSEKKLFFITMPKKTSKFLMSIPCQFYRGVPSGPSLPRRITGY